MSSETMQPMKYLDEFITQEQFDKLLSHAKRERDVLLLKTFWYTSRRVSEIVRCLKPIDINYETSRVYFTILKKRRWCSLCKTRMKYNSDTKRWLCFNKLYQDAYGKWQGEWVDKHHYEKPRRVWLPIPKHLSLALKTYIEKNTIGEHEFIFKISRQRVDQIIKEIGKAAGMFHFKNRKIHIHIIRHSYAVDKSKKIKNMHDLKMLQKLLQHSSMEQTGYYMEHFTEDELEKFVNEGEENA